MTGASVIARPPSVSLQVATEFLAPYLAPDEEFYTIDDESDAPSGSPSAGGPVFVSADAHLEVDEPVPGEGLELAVASGLSTVSASSPSDLLAPYSGAKNPMQLLADAGSSNQDLTLAEPTTSPYSGPSTPVPGMPGIAWVGAPVDPTGPDTFSLYQGGPQPPPPPPPTVGGITGQCEILKPWGDDGEVKPEFEPTGSLGDFTGIVGWQGGTVDASLVAAASQPSTTSAADVGGFKAPPLPYCPPGYSFDFFWQSCWPAGSDHAGPPMGQPYPHACKCLPGESWLADTNKCWPRGQLGAGGEAVGPSGLMGQTSTLPMVDMKQQAPEKFTDWKYRRKKWGAGQCVGAANDNIRTAYVLAYEMIRSAELELEFLVSRPDPLDRRTLWSAQLDETHRAAWSFWFGHPDEVAPFDLDLRTSFVLSYLKAWSRAFRKGFNKTNTRPVFIRCKALECVGDGTKARHLIQNTVELCDGTYFDMKPDQRAITLLHEMGHFSGGNQLTPRDERNGTHCHLGWNAAKNICYRSPDRVLGNNGFVFPGGGPRELAKFSSGNSEAWFDMLNNVDNYVSIMWNRHVDRDTRRFEL